MNTTIRLNNDLSNGCFKVHFATTEHDVVDGNKKNRNLTISRLVVTIYTGIYGYYENFDSYRVSVERKNTKHLIRVDSTPVHRN